MQARKENQAFSHLVDVGKAMDKIDQRRKKRKLKEGLVANEEHDQYRNEQSSVENGHDVRKRKFRQTTLVPFYRVGKQYIYRGLITRFP